MFIFYNFDFAGVVVWDGNPPFDRRCGTWSFSRNRLSRSGGGGAGLLRGIRSMEFGI